MTKEEIIFNIISMIVIPIGSVLTGMYFSIYIKDKNPDIKKINSYIKKTLRLTIAYIIPISLITFFFITDDFNKFFILKILILSLSVVINAILFVIKKYITHLIDILKDIIKGMDIDRNATIEIVTIIEKIIKFNIDKK